jgi:hypothetical protein
MPAINSLGFEVPYREAMVDKANVLLTVMWQQFFTLLHLRLSPLGIEISCPIANNVSGAAAKDIDGLVFNSTKTNHAIVDYIIQRITSGSGSVALFESGTLYLTYKAPNGWALQQINPDSPDDTGVNFGLKQEVLFTVGYSHITGLWTKNNHGLYDGNAVTLGSTATLPSGYSSNTTYYVINSTTNTFKLSATKGGAAVTAATNSGTGTISAYSNSGQVTYSSSNITGTANVSKITWRARTLAAKVAS